MKIKDLINEGVTDIVARFYKEASTNTDRFYNLEDVKYKELNKEYYDEHFKQWFAEDVVPVFTKPTTRPQPVYNSEPTGSKLQSPGFRGLQYALHAAGLPYNRGVQKYNPSATPEVSGEMDVLRNNSTQ